MTLWREARAGPPCRHLCKAIEDRLSGAEIEEAEIPEQRRKYCVDHADTAASPRKEGPLIKRSLKPLQFLPKRGMSGVEERMICKLNE
jgi:hypothetical protein